MPTKGPHLQPGTRLHVPPEALTVLEVFILEPQELNIALAEYEAAAAAAEAVAEAAHAAAVGGGSATAAVGVAVAAASAALGGQKWKMPVLEVGVAHDPQDVIAVLNQRFLMSKQELGHHIGAMGLRMGAITTLVR